MVPVREAVNDGLEVTEYDTPPVPPPVKLLTVKNDGLFDTAVQLHPPGAVTLMPPPFAPARKLWLLPMAPGVVIV
jgi:hypothetical protein